ncbi:MAG: acyltransferase [Legionella sp.]|nr:acyltransferase [Legionella sp.]
MQCKSSGGQFQAIVATFVLILSTTIFFIPILFMGLLKLYPNERWQALCTQGVDAIVTRWCDTNNWYIDKTQSIHWQISGLEHLDNKHWYLVIANHQSWLDIVILQRLLNHKIPILKFFIKDQLKWVPLLGFSWWAMGCPFMKRYSKKYLEKNPHKQGKDLISTRKAIEKFKKKPASIMNFVEGTRFSPQKKAQQNSPYRYLLKPKAGGIGFILNAMGEQLTGMLDVTIIYPQKPSLWDFLCKRISKVTIHVRQIPIPKQFTLESSMQHSQTKAKFIDWLNEKWMEKDNLISSLKLELE